MPFPPINLHQRIASPGRELFRRKKAPPPPPELLRSKPGEEERNKEEMKHFSEKLSASWTSAANLKNLGRKPQQQQHKTKPPPTTFNTTTRGLVTAGQEARRGGGGGGNRNPCRLTAPKPQDSSYDALTLSSSVEEASMASHRSSRRSSSRGSLGREPVPITVAPPPDIQFTLSLTPEAILVIQKRNLEKQQRSANNSRQQKASCCAPAGGAAGDSTRHSRRAFPSSSSCKKTHGGGAAQQHRSGIPVKQPPGATQQPDITAIVKISLLNDQYKYDDVEYEEEDGDVDETVVRKCKEWLKGVESAAAFNGKADKLCALPHLKGC